MKPDSTSNIYLPRPAVIRKIVTENSQIQTFVLAFADEDYNRSFSYSPGQFMMLSVPDCGEAPISFSSTPTRPGTIELSVRKAGRLTSALHGLEAGAVVGLRGPYGRSFPLDSLRGLDLMFVAGGIGLAPLRSVINYCCDREGDFGRLTILYGSRTPEDIAFQEDLEIWRRRPEVECRLTVDQAGPEWRGAVGVVTNLLDDPDMSIDQTAALVCGPPLMIRFVLARLVRLGLPERRVITTLERHMKCGVGVCGHCHMDDRLICIDGPVFNHAELMEMDVAELIP